MSSPSGQNRGGTPIGVRALLGARPCWQHGRLQERLSAFRFLSVFVLAKATAQTHEGTTPSLQCALAFALHHRGVQTILPRESGEGGIGDLWSPYLKSADAKRRLWLLRGGRGV
jgi:hypothetical protein